MAVVANGATCRVAEWRHVGTRTRLSGLPMCLDVRGRRPRSIPECGCHLPCCVGKVAQKDRDAPRCGDRANETMGG